MLFPNIGTIQEMVCIIYNNIHIIYTVPVGVHQLPEGNI
jgi:hypothetical protein